MNRLLILLILAPGFVMASGSGDRPESISSAEAGASATSGDTIGGDLTGGDMISGNNKAITVVAPGMGDVDIAGCLGSTQFSLLIGAKQKLVLNHICMAEFYLQVGRYKLAAQSLCNQPEILAEYEDERSCELQHDFTPPVVVIEDPPASIEVPMSGPQDCCEEQIAQVEQGYKEGYESLEQRLARVERGNQIASRKAQERREYAQHTIERLENDPER